MPLNLGSAAISSLRLGTATPSKVMLGSTQVWPSAPWTPLDMNALLYLDAKVPSSVILGSGTQVTQWNDLSAIPTNSTQANASNQFNYDAANGLILLGAIARMTFDPRLFVNLPDFCVFMMWADRWSAIRAGTGAAIISAIDNRVSQNWAYDFLFAVARETPPPLLLAQVNNGADASSMISAPFLVDDQAVMWGNRWEGALPSGAKQSNRINGASIIATEGASPATTSASTLNIGWLNEYNSAWGSAFGKVATIVVCRASDYDANITRLEGWAAHNWSQQALLPAGHPYKSAPPMK